MYRKSRDSGKKDANGSYINRGFETPLEGNYVINNNLQSNILLDSKTTTIEMHDMQQQRSIYRNSFDKNSSFVGNGYSTFKPKRSKNKSNSQTIKCEMHTINNLSKTTDLQEDQNSWNFSLSEEINQVVNIPISDSLKDETSGNNDTELGKMQDNAEENNYRSNRSNNDKLDKFKIVVKKEIEEEKPIKKRSESVDLILVREKIEIKKYGSERPKSDPLINLQEVY